MSFTTFNIPYPTYSIVTPQTGYNVDMRSMSVSDEEFLKGSLVIPKKLTDHLNKAIFNCLATPRPDYIKTQEDMEKNLTLKDRFALLYGLLHVSYKDIRNYDINCRFCGKKFPLTVSADQTFNMKPYTGKDILKKRIKIELPVFRGVSAYIKQPSLKDEKDSYLTFGYEGDIYKSDIVTEIMIIDKFEHIIESEVKEGKEPKDDKKIIYSERSDIYQAYVTLPPRDKKEIHKKYQEEFGQYEVSLKFPVVCKYKDCPSKGEEDIIDIDIVDALFRALYE